MICDRGREVISELVQYVSGPCFEPRCCHHEVVLETADQLASVAGFVIAVIGLVIALRQRRSPTTAERLDQLAEVVAAQWRDEAEIRRITTAWTTVELPAHRRLVVVGPAGAGKTVAAVRLVRELLSRRAPGEPVAVLFALHSWNPVRQHPHEWMAEELAGNYRMSSSVARELVRARHILPVLDGLDEVCDPAAALRALHLIHDPATPDPLILTSRDHVTLTGATVVELGPPQVPGWEGTTSSPLLLWLALASDTDPAELAGVSDVEAEKHLLDRFVTATYPEAPLPAGRRPRWRARRVEHWLRFLARQENIVWWQLIRLVPRTAIVLLPALLVGPMVWVGLWLCFPEDIGLAAGVATANALTVALMGVVRPYPDVFRLAAGLRLHPLGMLGGFAVGFFLGWIISPVAAVVAGAVSGVLWGIVGRIDNTTPPRAAHPLAVLRADLLVTVVGSLPLPATIATGVAFAVSPWRAPLGFFTFWLFYGFGWITVTAWSRFVVARLWLAARGRTPLRLMTFLDDAHRRGVLRRVGPTYEFRHARLRERLAGPATSEEHQARPV